MKWHQQLPEVLRSSAYLSEGGEPAWPRDAALEVVEYLRGKQFAILGVEIWIATHPGPTIPLYQWSRSDARDSLANPQTADEYIQRFSWAADDDQFRDQVPFFNLTVADRRSP